MIQVSRLKTQENNGPSVQIGVMISMKDTPRSKVFNLPLNFEEAEDFMTNLLQPPTPSLDPRDLTALIRRSTLAKGTRYAVYLDPTTKARREVTICMSFDGERNPVLFGLRQPDETRVIADAIRERLVRIQ